MLADTGATGLPIATPSICSGKSSSTSERGMESPPAETEPAPRPHASPGLLRRRYSVPETVMRRYRVAQQRSESEQSSAARWSAASACASPAPPASPAAPASPQRARRDRELMRRSALLRRARGRPPPAPPTADLSDGTFQSHGGRGCSCAASPDATDCESAPSGRASAAPPLAGGRPAAETPAPSSSPPRAGDGPEEPAYRLLEVVVSSAGPTPPSAGPAPALRLAPDSDIDEYVSHILVESLHSLSEQLESMNAAIGPRRLSVLEQEIKVRLQNTGVNTIVHLSPTSNHQIIFGNEELCGSEAAEPLAVREERAPGADSDDGLTSSGSGAPAAAPAPAPRDVDRAVLQQIQRLFRDELRGLERAAPPAGVALVQVSDVDAFLAAAAAPALAGVGAGNYCGAAPAPAVPRFSAFPHSESMEVNTSEEERREPRSDCTSLADSLEEPRAALPSPRAAPARSPLARAPPPASAEAFFVRIEPAESEAAPARPGPEAAVARCLPERLRQRLHRRQRTRELRAECARRSRARQLQRSLERRRREDAAAARRALEADCRAVLRALLDDVVGRVARDELRAARERRGAGAARRREPARLVRGQLPARPSLARPARPPRRIYQKSEIHEGEKCIEILEILEYVQGSPSSPEPTTSDENHNLGSKCRKSRIPVPVAARPLPAPPPTAPAAAPGSLRFRRVFDMIPEERSSLSLDSSPESPAARRAPPAPATPAPSPPARRSQTTMTSPCSRSAATSPRRPASPPAPARPPREGTVCLLRPLAPHRTAPLAVE